VSPTFSPYPKAEYIMKPKYMLHPDFVKSKRDGDEHYISCSQLIKLYGVPLRDCVKRPDRALTVSEMRDYIHLHPQYDGDYTLPTT
jgi:hypothetical protein